MTVADRKARVKKASAAAAAAAKQQCSGRVSQEQGVAHPPRTILDRISHSLHFFVFDVTQNLLSAYLHKSEYLDLSLEGKTTAFFHSKGAAVAL